MTNAASPTAPAYAGLPAVLAATYAIDGLELALAAHALGTPARAAIEAAIADQRATLKAARARLRAEVRATRRARIEATR